MTRSSAMVDRVSRSDPRGATIEPRTHGSLSNRSVKRQSIANSLDILLFRRATCGEETVARETRARRLQSRCCTRGVTGRDTLHRRLFAILCRGINSREASRNNKRGPRSISIPLPPLSHHSRIVGRGASVQCDFRNPAP